MLIRPRKTSCRRGALENKAIHPRWVVRKSGKARRPRIRWKSNRVILEETEEGKTER